MKDEQTSPRSSLAAGGHKKVFHVIAWLIVVSRLYFS